VACGSEKGPTALSHPEPKARDLLFEVMQVEPEARDPLFEVASVEPKARDLPDVA
jgi:hypothetical protein